MNKKDLLQKIDTLLKKIQEQLMIESENTSQPEEMDISHEQMDSILSDTRELYEDVILLNHLSSNTPVKAHTEPEVVTHKEEILTPVKTEEETSTLENEDESSIMTEKTETQEQSVEQEDKVKETEPQMNLFPTGQKTVNENIATQENAPNIASKLEKEPINDLKTAIGINEKFLFTNELFNGNQKDFEDSLDYLNKAKDQEEANNYIENNLIKKYSWDEESDSVTAFLSLIERRFLS